MKFLLSNLSSGDIRSEILNDVDEDGWTALHIAAFRGNEDVVEALLQEKCLDIHALTMRPYRVTADVLADMWRFPDIARRIRWHDSQRKIEDDAENQALPPWWESVGFQARIWRRQIGEKMEDKKQPSNYDRSQEIKRLKQSLEPPAVPQKIEGFMETEKLLKQLQSEGHDKSPSNSDETVWLHFQANNVSAFPLSMLVLVATYVSPPKERMCLIFTDTLVIA